MTVAVLDDRETLPGHVRADPTPTALAAILRPDVTMTLWRRPPPVRIDDADGFPSVRVTARPGDAAVALEQALVDSPRFPWLAAVVADAAMLAGLFASIMDVEFVELRLDRIVGDACRRFHADYVAARLLCTYAGRGTEWLDQASVAAASTEEPRATLAGEVAIMKGRDLAGDAALVHRSPPIAQWGEERLLLVIDPVPRPG